MNNIKEGTSYLGEIIDIQPAGHFHAKGNNDVVVVDRTREGRAEESWYPLPQKHDLFIGDRVLVTPMTRFHESRGSLTRYHLTRLP